MLYAVDGAGTRILPVKQTRALCPGCKQPVIARCGDVNADHWAHVTGCECDPWHEPETRWHVNWKMQFEEHCREIVLPPHRADVCATRVHTDGEARMVIELQHSPIEPAEIEERENFYFDKCNHMCWVIDAREIIGNFEFGSSDKFDGGASIRTNFRWKWFRKSWGTVLVHLGISILGMNSG
jgi:competence protein CoiA